jgi:hypothetical protein
MGSRHARVGHVFQGRFKAILVEREHNLLELARYIVLNPVRAKMVEPGSLPLEQLPGHFGCGCPALLAQHALALQPIRQDPVGCAAALGRVRRPRREPALALALN